MACDRRTVIAGLALALLPAGLEAAPVASPHTRLILLGTAGGPRPRRNRSGSAQVIVSGEELYVIDCGDGVARQMVLAGLQLNRLRDVFITHHHSDHNADFGTLLHLAWLSGLTKPVGCWGPPPTAKMVESYLHYQEYDIGIRVRDEGRTDFASLIRAHDLHDTGEVLRDGTMRVSAAKVHHPPLDLALAYRFDAPDRSIVISGDTTSSDSLIRLAQGADVLVHEVMLADRVAEMLRPLPNRQKLTRSVLSHHTSAEEVGRVAAAAGVKLLVLSHFVPAEDPVIPDEEWIAPVREHYSGPIVVGRDLMEI